jgi:hypothetical protein
MSRLRLVTLNLNRYFIPQENFSENICGQFQFCWADKIVTNRELLIDIFTKNFTNLELPIDSTDKFIVNRELPNDISAKIYVIQELPNDIKSFFYVIREWTMGTISIFPKGVEQPIFYSIIWNNNINMPNIAKNIKIKLK